jgi:hypothetical protein
MLNISQRAALVGKAARLLLSLPRATLTNVGAPACSSALSVASASMV